MEGENALAELGDTNVAVDLDGAGVGEEKAGAVGKEGVLVALDVLKEGVVGDKEYFRVGCAPKREESALKLVGGWVGSAGDEESVGCGLGVKLNGWGFPLAGWPKLSCAKSNVLF